MPERLSEFLTGVKAAREQSAADRKALLRRLTALNPEQFVRLPREVLQQLSDKQYDEVVEKIAPEHHLPQPAKVARRKRRCWSPARLWNAMPASAWAAVAGLSVGLLVFIATLAVGPALEWWNYQNPPVRSVDASTWPHCARLSVWVDGCTYTAGRHLMWGETASLLAMSELQLREINRHIEQGYIPAQTTLIVWRNRGTLQGGRQ